MQYVVHKILYSLCTPLFPEPGADRPHVPAFGMLLQQWGGVPTFFLLLHVTFLGHTDPEKGSESLSPTCCFCW